MGRILMKKNKQARREGVDLSLKTPGTKSHARLLARLNIPPGNKSVRKIRSKISDYGIQLREKQKLKRIYAISEAMMSKYFHKAVEKKGNTILHLIQSLETRIDNVLYRAGFAPTRNAARQLVTHGHVAVNGNKIDIPSYSVGIKDIVTFRKKNTKEIPYIKTLLEGEEKISPWIKWKKDGAEIIDVPNLDEYKEPVDMLLVIEFYSKL
ncbi:30S ribosomal protein S4 [Candidatus Roizmanbacteria bacterium CG10_big_fil_rev_8_21_14_0_10_39_6]|uniref:Small ribosomal subunit protein uS4 n=1 Tax=Candidatus Roizmanbacteria bacterium CG10_big_fil_rev_8_21_14_0_10_39_6 TaxID=1974853 RepID=A0A2M8KSB9_9BACT|nr:MAG: 30S ribosomal protein S4 [Candidatus Roizmanbacteria bacterium CG10_big_fil_rev_8_21_14_0_10_39_6]